MGAPKSHRGRAALARFQESGDGRAWLARDEPALSADGPKPGEMRVRGPGARRPPGAPANGPVELESLPMVVEAGLEGALEGWVATFAFGLFDADGAPVDHWDDGPGAVAIDFVRPVELRPPAGADPFATTTSRAYRALKVPTLMDRLLEHARAIAPMAPAWGRAAEAKRPRRSGRRGTPDVEYVMWVLRRLEAEQVAPDAPVKWLSDRYHRSAAGIDGLLAKACDRGLARAKAGPSARTFKLTAKGERLVARAKELATEGGL